MGSSSDLEFLDTPQVERSASPVVRKSSRVRRAPRGVDELAAPAAPQAAPHKRTANPPARTNRTQKRGIISDDDDDDNLSHPDARPELKAISSPLEILPTTTTSVPTVKRKHPVIIASSSSSSSLPLPSRPDKSRGPKSPVPSPVPRSTSLDSTLATTTLPRSQPSTTPKKRSSVLVPKKPVYVKPPGGDSSDEADDFFNMNLGATKTVPTAARAGGRLPKAIAARSSATPFETSPPKSQPQATETSLIVSSSSDSEPADAHSDSSIDSRVRRRKRLDPSSDLEGQEHMTKNLTLPAWARGRERPLKRKSATPDRKRSRVDVDSNQERLDGWSSDRHEGDSDDSISVATNGKRSRPLVDEGAAPRAAARSGKRQHLSQPVPKAKKTSPRKPSPPPMVKVSTAQELLAKARGLRPTSPSSLAQNPIIMTSNPTLMLGSSSEGEEGSEALDPSLAAIRATSRRTTYDPLNPLELLARGRAPRVQEDVEGKVTIMIGIGIPPDLVIPAKDKAAYAHEVAFELGLNQPFSTIFTTISARTDKVWVHKKSQVYDFGTPKSLKLRAGSTAHFKVYSDTDWNRIVQLEQERIEKGISISQDPDQDDADLSALDHLPTTTQSQSTSTLRDSTRTPSVQPSNSTAVERSRSPAPVSGDDNLFRLTVRGSKTRSINVAVKWSTTIQSLIKAYCKTYSIVDATRISKMFVEIEGDKVPPHHTVQEIKDEFDLEDEETIDLRGDPGA
ncbi:uncharacterized protein JCM15063_004607 [Sporobolomyces koalae]|uniref:uncharacterized protein n=1 Tax=Sporobolomyces koalae TaxID=500713 RepID=UPI003178F9F6